MKQADLGGNVIVGAGEAGVAAAFEMRRCGYAGRIVLLDSDPEYPYARPPLSKAILRGSAAPEHIVEKTSFEAARIELHRGTWVRAINPRDRIVEFEGDAHGKSALRYEHLLLATGATARSLPGGKGYRLRSLEDSRALGAALAGAADLVIVGGGTIWLEVASMAHALGLPVTVLEAQQRLMSRCLPPSVSSALEQIHRSSGVDLRLGVRILTLSSDRGTIIVGTDDGRRVSASLLMTAIGADPATQLAEQAGCTVCDGVVVDVFGETSVPGIFAAGDVASTPLPRFLTRRRLESWQHARRHGACVARNICRQRQAYDQVPWFWTDQHGTNLQVAGLFTEADEEVVRPAGDNAFTHFFARDGRLTGAITINCAADMRPAIKLIEAGWRGPLERLADPSQSLREAARALMAPGVIA